MLLCTSSKHFLTFHWLCEKHYGNQKQFPTLCCDKLSHSGVMSACQILRWQMVVYEDGKWICTRFWLHCNGLPPSSSLASNAVIIWMCLQHFLVMLTPRAAGRNLYHFGTLCCCSVQNKLKFKKLSNKRIIDWHSDSGISDLRGR